MIYLFIKCLLRSCQISANLLGVGGKLKGKIDKNPCPGIDFFLVGENIYKQIEFELYRILESDKQCEK